MLKSQLNNLFSTNILHPEVQFSRTNNVSEDKNTTQCFGGWHNSNQWTELMPLQTHPITLADETDDQCLNRITQTTPLWTDKQKA